MTKVESLRIFITVAKQRHFSKAAEILNMPKSTVSRKIRELEKHLGVELISRNNRRFELTQSGQLLLSKGLDAINLIEQTFDDVRSQNKEIQGHIKIATTVDLAKLYLSEPISIFLTKYPKVTIDLDVSSKQLDLIADQVDLAVRAGDLNDSIFFSKKLPSRIHGFFVGKNYLKKRRILAISDLDGHPIISINTKRVLDKRFVPTLKINNMSLVAELTANNLGVGILDSGIAGQYTRNGYGLVQILEDYSIDKTPIHMIYPNKNPPARVRELMEIIIGQSRK